MYDTENVADMQKLVEQIPKDYESLGHIREARRETIRSIEGNHYVDPNADDANLLGAQPANFNGMATDILVRSLISSNPRIYAESDARELTVMTETFEAAVNDRLQQMRIVDDLELATYDAVLGPMAITLVGRERNGFLNETGFPRSKTICRTISPDLVSWDVDARQWDEIAYFAHQIRVREIDFLKSPNYPSALKEAVQPRHLYEARDIDGQGQPLVEDMVVSKSSLPVGSGRRYVMLWYCYLPTVGKTCYFPMHYTRAIDTNPAFAVRKWAGWNGGPYHRFGFDIVPDNVVWRSPVKDMILDMGRILNDMVTRIMTDVRDRKLVGVVDPMGADTIDQIRDAKHGDYVSGNAQGSTTVQSGGLDNLTLVAFVHLKKLWDELGGNISILGGLPGSFPTATEAGIRNNNSSGKIEKMRQRQLRWVTDLAEAIAEYEWKDPDAGRILERELYGGVKRRLDFSYIQPRGSFKRWRINVHPYSLQHRSPTQVVQMLDQFVSQLILPSLPLFHQAGITFDIQAYTRTRARLLDMPIMDQMLIPLSNTDSTQIGRGYQPGKPATTQRFETRLSEAQNPEQQMMKTLSALNSGADQSLQEVA